MRFKFTDSEVKKIMKEMIVIIDTREKANDHVKVWFEAKKKKYKVQKIDQGDYSCYIPKGVIKGIDRDIYFDKAIVVERKANIDEIASNFSSSDYPRISKEFAILKSNNTKCRLFVEDTLFHKHLRNGTFRSEYDPKTLHARLKGFEAEFGITIEAVGKEYMGSEIYNTLYYYVRDYLKRKFEIEEVEI